MLRITCKKFLGLAQQQQHQPRPVVQSLFRLYHERVVDHYDNPRNVGSFDKNDPTVGTGLVGAPACGDVMKLQIKVDDDGKIIDACFKTFGCGSAIASSSVGIRTTSIQILSHWIRFNPMMNNPVKMHTQKAEAPPLWWCRLEWEK
ncbi:Iron-sulfur cluster assembly protein 3 [Ranunculus cassubicifolius]